jgi:hypothetical protein
MLLLLLLLSDSYCRLYTAHPCVPWGWVGMRGVIGRGHVDAWLGPAWDSVPACATCHNSDAVCDTVCRLYVSELCMVLVV